MSYSNLDPQTALERLKTGDYSVLDVRTQREHQSHRVEGAQLIPVQELSNRHDELEPEKEYLVFCEHGIRSVAACELLTQQGFGQLTNVEGGMARWIAEGLPYVQG